MPDLLRGSSDSNLPQARLIEKLIGMKLPFLVGLDKRMSFVKKYDRDSAGNVIKAADALVPNLKVSPSQRRSPP